MHLRLNCKVMYLMYQLASDRSYMQYLCSSLKMIRQSVQYHIYAFLKPHILVPMLNLECESNVHT